MTKSNRQASALHEMRPGEGFPISIIIQSSKVEGSVATATVQANISVAPVPNKRYSADAVYVDYSFGHVRIMFAQAMLDPEAGLRTLLIIKMTPSWVSKFLESLEVAGERSIGHLIERALEAGMDLDLPEIPKSEPRETVSFSANLVMTAINGGEGCMDFYHASPFAINGALATKKLGLDPVVRVDLTAPMLFAMAHSLKNLLVGLPDTESGQLPFLSP